MTAENHTDIQPPREAVAEFVGARSGNRAALDALRSSHRAGLRIVASGYLLDGSDPDVVVEEALRALHRVATPESDGAVTLSLFALVRHAALAKNQAAGHLDPTPFRALGAQSTPPQLSPIRRGHLLDEFAKLDGRDQAVLWFRAFENLDDDALSEVLSLKSAEKAQAAVTSARAHLRAGIAKASVHDADLPDACRGFVVHLAAMADGNVSPRREETLRAHLEGDQCAHCQALVADIGGVLGLLGTAAAPIVRGSSLQSAVTLEALVDFEDDLATLPTSSEAAVVASAGAVTMSPALAPEIAGEGHRVARRRAAPVALGAAAVVLIIGLVWWGMTAGAKNDSADNLTVAVDATTTSTTNDAALPGLDDDSTATTTASSSTGPQAKTAKPTTKKPKTKTGSTTRRPARNGSPQGTASWTGRNPGGTGGTSGTVAPNTTAAPVTPTTVKSTISTTTTTLAVAVAAQPGIAKTFTVTVNLPAGASASGHSMLLKVPQPAKISSTTPGCAVVNGHDNQLRCDLSPNDFTPSDTGKIWTNAAITVQGSSGFPTMSASLITTP